MLVLSLDICLVRRYSHHQMQLLPAAQGPAKPASWLYIASWWYKLGDGQAWLYCSGCGPGHDNQCSCMLACIFPMGKGASQTNRPDLESCCAVQAHIDHLYKCKANHQFWLYIVHLHGSFSRGHFVLSPDDYNRSLRKNQIVPLLQALANRRSIVRVAGLPLLLLFSVWSDACKEMMAMSCLSLLLAKLLEPELLTCNQRRWAVCHGRPCALLPHMHPGTQ